MTLNLDLAYNFLGLGLAAKSNYIWLGLVIAVITTTVFLLSEQNSLI